MVEVPADGITLSQLQQINRYLLASGKDIHAMNAWRKKFSKIKGGGLLRYVQHLQCTQLLISDVQGNDPATIGVNCHSNVTMPHMAIIDTATRVIYF